MSNVQRLGRNRGGYFGDPIDIDGVLRETLAAAHRHGWRIELLPAGDGLVLAALHRPAKNAERRFYISAGIHGDEPAGPMAVHALIEENAWPVDAELWLCPCLNPSGFRIRRRENRHGRDLNRDYKHLATDEVRAHTGWLRAQPNFDLTLCLHEDWESHGFYLYELNPDNRPSLAQPMIDAVAAVCPIDLSPEIEGRSARGGIIAPSLDPNSRPEWPEAFFLIQNKTAHSYTLEAPSDFALEVRVRALVVATTTALGVR